MESHKIHVPNHRSVYNHNMIEHGMDLDGPEIHMPFRPSQSDFDVSPA